PWAALWRVSIGSRTPFPTFAPRSMHNPSTLPLHARWPKRLPTPATGPVERVSPPIADSSTGRRRRQSPSSRGLPRLHRLTRLLKATGWSFSRGNLAAYPKPGSVHSLIRLTRYGRILVTSETRTSPPAFLPTESTSCRLEWILPYFTKTCLLLNYPVPGDFA